MNGKLKQNKPLRARQALELKAGEIVRVATKTEPDLEGLREAILNFQKEVIRACSQAIKDGNLNYGVYDCSDYVLQR